MPFHQLMNKTYQAKTTQNSHIINEGDKFNEYIKHIAHSIVMTRSDCFMLHEII